MQDAVDVGERLRLSSSDPIVHAAIEALNATSDLLGLTTDPRREPSLDHDEPAPVAIPGAGSAAPCPTVPGFGADHLRDTTLRGALDSIRAASTAIRFALVEEGDRSRTDTHAEGTK